MALVKGEVLQHTPEELPRIAKIFAQIERKPNEGPELLLKEAHSLIKRIVLRVGGEQKADTIWSLTLPALDSIPDMYMQQLRDQLRVLVIAYDNLNLQQKAHFKTQPPESSRIAPGSCRWLSDVPSTGRLRLRNARRPRLRLGFPLPRFLCLAPAVVVAAAAAAAALVVKHPRVALRLLLRVARYRPPPLPNPLAPLPSPPHLRCLQAPARSAQPSDGLLSIPLRRPNVLRCRPLAPPPPSSLPHLPCLKAPARVALP